MSNTEEIRKLSIAITKTEQGLKKWDERYKEGKKERELKLARLKREFDKVRPNNIITPRKGILYIDSLEAPNGLVEEILKSNSKARFIGELQDSPQAAQEKAWEEGFLDIYTNIKDCTYMGVSGNDLLESIADMTILYHNGYASCSEEPEFYYRQG